MTVCGTASAQEHSGFLLKARERSGRVRSWILSYRRLGTSAEQFEGQALLVDVRLNILSRLKRMVESNHVLSVNRWLPQCEGNLPEHVFFGIGHPLAAESKDPAFVAASATRRPTVSSHFLNSSASSGLTFRFKTSFTA